MVDLSQGQVIVEPTPLDELRDDELDRAGVTLLLKRDDQLHPGMPGNKWRKLKYNLEAARTQGYGTLLTFGGAFSNHIYAVASAGELFGFRTIGLIRGEEHLPLNPVLRHAADRGMELHYIARDEYRHKDAPEFVAKLEARFGADFYLLPEGGSNELALRGCTEIVEEIDVAFDVICCPCGTGGTLAGLTAGLGNDAAASALGVAVLKGAAFLNSDVEALLTARQGRAAAPWEISLDYHFGGFAKVRPELLSFIADFRAAHSVELDPIYTGKMMYGLYDLISKGRWPAGTRIVAVHTGGAPSEHWATLA